MQRCTAPLSPHTRHLRAAAHAAVLGAFALACAEPAGPVASVETVSESPNAIIIIGGRPVTVFNAVLRSIGNPDEAPAALGHVQLRLSELDDGGIIIEWRLVLTDDAAWPFCMSEGPGASTLGGGIYFVQDSEDLPSPEVRPAVDLLESRNVSCQGSVLVGSTGISEELAARMVQDPENFVALFYSDPDQSIAGTLQLGGPDTAPGT